MSYKPGDAAGQERDRLRRLRRRQQHREAYREQRRRYRARNRERIRAYGLAWRRAKKYGLTREQVEAQLITQEGGCWICRAPIDFLTAHVDHDHEIGRNRGLLCRRCNHGIGNFKDNPALLRKAALYLEVNLWHKELAA